MDVIIKILINRSAPLSTFIHRLKEEGGGRFLAEVSFQDFRSPYSHAVGNPPTPVEFLSSTLNS